MAQHDSYTRLLGLALRGGNLVTGSDAVQSAIHAGKVRLLLLSADASARTCRDAQQWSERGHCLCVALPCDKDELGQALGRGSVAIAALTDTGLANAVGERLAQFDPERYAYLSERLQRKVVRAGERRAARARARPDNTKAPPRPVGGDVAARPPRPGKRRPNPNGTKARSNDAGKPAKAPPRPVAARRQRGEARRNDERKPEKARRDTGKRPGATKTPPRNVAARPQRRARPKKADT